MQKIEPKKATYVIASDSAFAPFEFQNAEGEYEGIDVRIIYVINYSMRTFHQETETACLQN